MSLSEDSVFVREGDVFVPTPLARGPWSAHAQHGGAPAGLLASLAESAVDDPDWCLTRLTLELLRPVPVAPLTVEVETGQGNSVRRVHLTLKHGETPVAQAAALLVRQSAVDVPPNPSTLPLANPALCTERVTIPGMAETTSFHYTAMEARLARGSTTAPGPAAAWFRLTVPLLNGCPTRPAARAVAAADFGNGISWVLPFDTFLFANTDLTVYLHRPPQGEWIAVDSEATVESCGVGLVHTVLYDERGRIGFAQQNLLIRARTTD